MFVLLYLLPLGLIFDLAGYLTPELRTFLLIALLALPLALRPSRRTAGVAAGVLGVFVLRAWWEPPMVADVSLMLLAHFVVWSVADEVPRALRTGVAGYFFLHLFLFLSPLGLPLVEHVTGALNEIAGGIAGQSFNLGPTYLGLGGLLLFLTLSVFAWDGSKIGYLRTAGFLGIALLLEALAAVVLIEKTDFAASFAWNLKFRDPLGLPELWPLLKGLNAIVFPAFVFLAQLAAYVALHAGRAPRAGGAALPAAEPVSLRGEFSWKTGAIAAALLGALAVVAATPPTAWRRPAQRGFVFVERGVVSFTKPDYQRYGESAGGMFGMLPEYVRLFGGSAEVVKDIPEALDPAKVLVLTNLDEDIGEAVRKRVWAFVENGGALWILGDHTFIKNGRNHLNEILEPVHISFVNDSAQFFPQGWFHSYRFPQGTPYGALPDDAENRPGILVGASLLADPPAVPLVMGKFGYGDLGLEEPEGDRGYLGDFKYQPTERLGDLVLVAGQRFGRGRVLVFGDTSSFFNNNLVRSFELLRSSMAWLGEGRAWAFPATTAGRWLAGALALAACGGLFLRRTRPAAVPALAGACLVSLVCHGDGGLPAFEKTFAREHLALIDFSHAPGASKHSAMESGLHGVSINLLRYGMLPLATNSWDGETLEKARLLVMPAPRRPITEGERGELMDFMENGGTVVLTCGYLDAAASSRLLDPLGVEISDIPLGRFFDRTAFGQPVSFMSAWAIAKAPPRAEILCASADWPLMVRVPVGRGGLVVIADSEFLHNRNVEGHKNHDPANTAFIKNLLDATLR